MVLNLGEFTCEGKRMIGDFALGVSTKTHSSFKHTLVLVKTDSLFLVYQNNVKKYFIKHIQNSPLNSLKSSEISIQCLVYVVRTKKI